MNDRRCRHLYRTRGCVGCYPPQPVDQHRAWFARTGHCGACGQPGTYCLCTEPCGCADQHPVGSGLRPDALTDFADTIPSEQGELFG